jgi:hypothetical protein
VELLLVQHLTVSLPLFLVIDSHTKNHKLWSSSPVKLFFFFFQMAICHTKDQKPCAATSYSIPPSPHHEAYIGNYGGNHKKSQAIG